MIVYLSKNLKTVTIRKIVLRFVNKNIFSKCNYARILKKNTKMIQSDDLLATFFQTKCYDILFGSCCKSASLNSTLAFNERIRYGSCHYKHIA